MNQREIVKKRLLISCKYRICFLDEGKLIEDAGLRGFRIGDAQVSEKHCGFVINRGNATAAQVCELMQEVVKKVKETSGVTLEPEVKRIGEF